MLYSKILNGNKAAILISGLISRLSRTVYLELDKLFLHCTPDVKKRPKRGISEVDSCTLANPRQKEARLHTSYQQGHDLKSATQRPRDAGLEPSLLFNPSYQFNLTFKAPRDYLGESLRSRQHNKTSSFTAACVPGVTCR